MTDQAAREALKPCPFCAGAGHITAVPNTGRFRPQCGKCGAGFGEFNRENDAATAWNTRAQEADARDGARYRQIRKGLSEYYGDVYGTVFDPEGDYPAAWDELDKHVDAAMAAQSGEAKA